MYIYIYIYICRYAIAYLHGVGPLWVTRPTRLAGVVGEERVWGFSLHKMDSFTTSVLLYINIYRYIVLLPFLSYALVGQ